MSVAVQQTKHRTPKMQPEFHQLAARLQSLDTKNSISACIHHHPLMIRLFRCIDQSTVSRAVNELDCCITLESYREKRP